MTAHLEQEKQFQDAYDRVEQFIDETILKETVKWKSAKELIRILVGSINSIVICAAERDAKSSSVGRRNQYGTQKWYGFVTQGVNQQ